MKKMNKWLQRCKAAGKTFLAAFAVFLLIKGINKVQSTLDSKDEAAAPTTRECPYCCEQIPLAAIRCPHCTSELEVVPSAKKRGRKPLAADAPAPGAGAPAAKKRGRKPKTRSEA